MSTEIKVKFGDLGKASIYSNRRYSRECWERCAKDLLEYHRRIPIRLGSDITERDVGYVELTSFCWPEAVFEGYVMNEGEVALKAIKNCPMAFTAKGEAVYNAQENRSIVYKMDLICLNPSAAPSFDSSVEIVCDAIEKAKSTVYLSYKVEVSTEYMLDQMAAAGKLSPYQKVVTCRYTEVWRCRECDAELPSFLAAVCPCCKANLITDMESYEV